MSPSPSPLPQLEPTQVSPGLAGFLSIFIVAVACVVLFLSLSRHLRRMRHNAEVQGVGPGGPPSTPAPGATTPAPGTTTPAPGATTPGDGETDQGPGPRDAGSDGERRGG